MKKFVIFIIALLGMQSLIAQDRYNANLVLTLRSKEHSMECDTRVIVTLFLANGTSKQETLVIPHNIGGGPYTFPSKTIKLSSHITSIKCEGIHRDDPSKIFTGCITRDSGVSSVSVSSSDYPCFSNKTVTSFMGKYDNGSNLKVSLTPIPPTISYNANGVSDPKGELPLPDTKKIRLTATGGYVSSVYTWKYSTDGLTWKDDFPAPFQGSSSIEFDGNDLFSDFHQLVASGKNVHVRLDYGCGWSSTQTLTPLLVAPKINEVTDIPTTCARDDNGQIRIKYSRPLYEGEYLNFQVNSQESSDTYAFLYGWNDPNLTKDLENQEITIKNVRVGTYKVRLLSYLNDDTRVLYTDDSNDFFRQNITISFGGEPVEALTPVETTDALCKGEENGTLTLGAKGGSGTYHIELYKITEPNDLFKQSDSFIAGEKATITGLPAGSYDAYIVDASGCISDFIPVDIYEPTEAFTIESVDIIEATFNDRYEEENNASIRISVSANENPYTYTWREGDENGRILLNKENENLPVSVLEKVNSGSYYVNISNATGCSIDTVIVIERSPNISVSIEQTGSIVCSGDNTGQLTATINGGVPPYTYEWCIINEYNKQEIPLGVRDLVLPNITAGRYLLRVTDAKGSRAKSQPFTQTEMNPIIVNFQTKRLNCSNDTDGFLEAQISGGTPPYTYTWNDGSSNLRLEGLTTGLYTIHVVDAAGCYKDAIGVVEGPVPLNIEAKITYPSCYDMNNGRITLSVSGGIAPYSYKWSNGSEQPEITNLKAGTYSVTITDSKNCEVVQKEFVIDKPERLVADLRDYKPISKNNANDGSFSVWVKGGTLPYAIDCVKDGQQSVAATTSVKQNDESYLLTYVNLGPGIYEIRVKDANFNADPDRQTCSVNLSVNLPEPPPLVANIRETQSIACFDDDGGALEVVGTGGDLPYTYEWFKVESNKQIPLSVYTAAISGIKAGIYIAKISDSSGFTVFSPEFHLVQPQALSLSFKVKNNTCYGGEDGEISVEVQGGLAPYNYSWDSGDKNATISGKPNGLYSVTVTDRNGCQVSGEVSIDSPESLQLEYELRPMSCYGMDDASIKLNVSGGSLPYTFLWDTNSTGSVLENIGAGSYSVTISDANNCTFDTTFVVSDLLPIQAELSAIRTPTGYGYSNGAFTVEITGGNPPYNVYWTNEQGLKMDQVSIENLNNKAITTLGDVSEGNYYLYVEDNNYQKIKNSGIDSCGCAAMFLFYMPQPPKLEVNITEENAIACFGSADGAILSSVVGGVPFTTGLPYTYEWMLNGTTYRNNTTGITGLTAGTYQLKVTDANGIEAFSEPLSLEQPDSLVLEFQTADIKCSQDLTGWAEVLVSGGTPPYTYEWSTGGTSSRIENITKGKYLCWVKDANGCDITGIASVVQSNAVVIQAEMIEPTCNGGNDGRIVIELSGGEPPYTYEWENGEKTLNRSGLSKGTYTFTVTDFYGCSYEVETYELGEPEEITVDLGEDRELCIGQEVTIEAKIPEPAQSFTWYDETGKELFVGKEYTLSQAGTYTVKAITAKGCAAYGTITITRDNREIASDFLLASKVPINDDVYAVNVSIPEPDKVEWILPEGDGFDVIDENNQLLAVIFRKYGDYIIGMKTFTGKCWEITYKSVRVMDKIDIDHFEEADEPMLRSFFVMPNPAVDHFTAVIELKEESSVDLLLVDSGTGVVMQRKQLKGGAVYKEVFNLPPTQKGTYILRLAAPKVNAIVKVISK